MKTPDYLSYERYKKKKDKNPNKRILIFITTFFATLLLFTIIASSLSPDVDVTIGDESGTELKETGLGVKKFIDDRLKLIQMEDNSAGVSIKGQKKNVPGFEDAINESPYPDISEEKIKLPTKKDKQIYEGEEIEEEPINQPSYSPPRPTGKDFSNPFEGPKMAKVYVGRYSTLEQAQVAQEILMDAGLDVSPFIKNLGSYYTLQVGSYSSRAKAEGIAQELQKNNFPARVVQE